MKLYEIADDYKTLVDLVDSGEVSQECIADTLELVGASLAEKIEACLKLRQEATANEVKFKAEADRLLALAKAEKAKAGSLDEYVKSSLIKAGFDSINAGLFKVTIKKASKKLGEIKEDLVPDAFFELIPASRRLDKRALLSAAKLGKIDGVEVIDSERAMIVK